MEKNKVSFVIPVYNSENTIKNCIFSCTNQKYKNIEIIVVDDGSTDNTYSIVKKLSSNDGRIILFSQKNQGPFEARKYGVSKASGTYISFVDADDELSPFFISTIFNSIKSQFDLAQVNYAFKKEDLELNPTVTKFTSENNVNKILIDHINWRGAFCGFPAKIFRKDILNRLASYKTESLAEDLDSMYLILCSVNSIYLFENKLYLYNRQFSKRSLDPTIQKHQIDSLIKRHYFFVKNNFDISVISSSEKVILKEIKQYYSKTFHSSLSIHEFIKESNMSFSKKFFYNYLHIIFLFKHKFLNKI